MFFHNYYVKQEQIKDQIKEVEKDRQIRQIKKSEKERRRKAAQEAEWRKASWIRSIRWSVKDPRQISPN